MEDWNGGLIELIHYHRERQERFQAGQSARTPALRPTAELPFAHKEEESETDELASLLAEIENITKGEI